MALKIKVVGGGGEDSSTETRRFSPELWNDPHPFTCFIFFFLNNNIRYSDKVLVQLLVLITCQMRKCSSNKYKDNISKYKNNYSLLFNGACRFKQFVLSRVTIFT